MVFAEVDDDLTTSNPDILAIGDVIERPDTRFTHMSGTMAGMAVQTALFPDKGLPVNAPSRIPGCVLQHGFLIQSRVGKESCVAVISCSTAINPKPLNSPFKTLSRSHETPT